MTATTGRRRAPAIALGVLAVAIAAVVVLAFALSDNIVYFKTVSEAVASREDDTGRRIRMAGTVVAGSIDEQPDGTWFELTEGDATVVVEHRGSTPDLFEECAPLVVEGRWSSEPDGTTFESDRILIKHDNEYRAPDDAVPACPGDA